MSGGAGHTQITLAEAIARILALEQEDRLDEADDLADRVLAAAPAHPHVLHVTGIIAYKKGRIDEAIRRMEAAISLAPLVGLYTRNICEVYRGAGRLADAAKAARQAVAVAPGDSQAHFNLALIHYEQLDLDGAIAAANDALALEPDFAEAHFEKAEALLLAGRMQEGWESYEWRFRLKQAEGMLPKTGKPQWDGSNLAPGRLMIIADQGFGDCVQFARLIPWAAARAPRPILACSLELTSLLRQVPGLGKLVNHWEQTGDYDAYVPLSGLPRLAGITATNIPAAEPYLKTSPALLAAWAARLEQLVPGHLRRIALVWAGRPTHRNDRKRTLSLAQFAPLFARRDIALLSVQKGPAADEIGDYFGAAPLINLGPEIGDFADTMAILQNVERLVSIDTSVLHVAGASGVPASLVLPYAPDWRWLLNRADTPWYGSVSLFRQHREYDWSGVIERVAADLDAP